MDEIVDRNARAVQGSVRVVAKVREADLSKPTPCAGWTLADLLTHMTVQHYGFAAAAEGNGADLSHWQPGQPDRGSLVSGYELAADRVMGAFAAEDILERKFCLPEVSTKLLFPARQAIGFHLVDYVVHGWDVARSSISATTSTRTCWTRRWWSRRRSPMITSAATGPVHPSHRASSRPVTRRWTGCSPCSDAIPPGRRCDNPAHDVDYAGDPHGVSHRCRPAGHPGTARRHLRADDRCRLPERPRRHARAAVGGRRTGRPRQPRPAPHHVRG